MSCYGSVCQVLVPFLLHSSIVFFSAFISMQLPEVATAGFINPLLKPTFPFIEKFIKWDAHWYTYTAQQGYDSQSIVFFPAIILFLRLGTFLGLDTALWGFILCNAFALSSFVMLYVVVRQDFSEQIARRVLFAYAVMPTSVFLNTIYTEPIFLTFSLGSLFFIRQNRWWSAGVCAALATLTRNLGVFLVVVMIIEWAMQNQYRQKSMKSLMPIVLPPLALAAFMTYNFWKIGSAFAFINGQKVWGRQFEYPWVNVWNNIVLLQTNFPKVELGVVLDIFLVFGCFIALMAMTVSRRYSIRLSYVVLGWVWFLIPLFSTSPWFPLYSMSRFILVIFPLYLWIAQLPKAGYYSYIIIGGVVLFYCTICFTSWRWLG